MANRMPLNPRKLPNVSSKYGAPMGRPDDSHILPDNSEQWREEAAARSVRVSRVPLVDGDYDTGGAYWGGYPSPPLFLVQWQLRDVTGDPTEWCAAFIRGTSALDVATRLEIPAGCLFRRLAGAT